MAAGRHNLSRRAVLGVVAGACASHPLAAAVAPAHDSSPFALSLSKGRPSAPDLEQEAGLRKPRIKSRAERDVAAALNERWTRALAAFRRAEARLAAFRRAEALLPPAAHAFPACAPLEERFNLLECARLAALKRLLRVPAPDLAAFALKLELAIEDQAWELTGAELFLAGLEADARRLALMRLR